MDGWERTEVLLDNPLASPADVVGFRQMAPLIAEYANLQAHRLRPIR
jgi:hypothetical protein